MREFTRREVEQISSETVPYNGKQKILMILDSKVLDVTDFVFDHPGGHALIKKFAGKDVSMMFRSDKYHVHSDLSSIIVKSLQVGVVIEEHEQMERKEPEYFKVEKVEEPEHFLDLTMPLVPQLLNSNISKADYMRLVHRPHHYYKEVTIFPWPLLERFTHTHWMMIPIVWGSISFLLGYLSLQDLAWYEFIKYFCYGIFLWTFVEYTVHRFVFHADTYVPDHPAALTLHFLGHAIHHYLPMEKSRLVMPLPLSGTLAICLWNGLARVLFDLRGAQGAFCGGILGYICYDLGHYFLHHGVSSINYLKDMKSYHVAHHYVDSNLGFGVSSKFWDYVFGTPLTN